VRCAALPLSWFLAAEATPNNALWQEIRNVSARLFVAGCVALLSGASALAQAATPGTGAPAEAPRATLQMSAQAEGVGAGGTKAMPGVRAADDAGLPTLTLEAALAEAQANNRTIKIATQNVLYSNDAILAAKTQRYPQFNVNFSASGLLTAVSVDVPKGVFGNVGGTPVPNNDSVITTNPKFSAMSYITVYQPLSQQYQIHLNVELLKVGKQLSAEQVRQQRQEIANSVSSAYYGLLQTQSALDAARENVKALRETERTTDEYVAQKAALPYQASAVKSQLAQAELQVVTLEDTMQTQKENLNDLMGRDITSDYRLSGVPDALPEETSLEAARATAAANRTEIKQASFKIDQAVFARRLEKANYIPQVGIQYLFFSPFTVEGLPSNINTVGINVKWDLWDWGYKKHLMDEKQRGIEQSRLNLTETQTQVAIDVSNRYRKLREARAGLKVAEMAEEAEQQKLAVVNEQYKQNAALLSTLQTEQSTMAQTTAQYQQALSNFWTARSEFEKALGEDQ
jgi:outer membrane protein TolC